MSLSGLVDDAELLRGHDLRGHDLRVKEQRLAVLRVLVAEPLRTADEIYEVARAEIGGIAAGSPARYENRVGDNHHHHLICRTCARIVDVDCAVGETPCLTAADGSGFEIEEAEVNYWGTCPECRSADRIHEAGEGLT